MSTKQETVYGLDAIDAFTEKHGGGVIQVWEYSPNGGVGGPLGNSTFYTQDHFRELIGRTEGGDWEFDGEKLEYNSPGEGESYMCVHQRYFFYVENPEEFSDAEVVACRGSYGFIWQSSCEEIDVFDLDKKYQTNILEELIKLFSGNSLSDFSKIGLEEIEDPTDIDGSNFAVINQERFMIFAEKCFIAQAKFDAWDLEVDSWSEEGLADLIYDWACVNY